MYLNNKKKMFQLLKVDEFYENMWEENMWEENRLQRIYFMKFNKKCIQPSF